MEWFVLVTVRMGKEEEIVVQRRVFWSVVMVMESTGLLSVSSPSPGVGLVWHDEAQGGRQPGAQAQVEKMGAPASAASRDFATDSRPGGWGPEPRRGPTEKWNVRSGQE